MSEKRSVSRLSSSCLLSLSSVYGSRGSSGLGSKTGRSVRCVFFVFTRILADGVPVLRLYSLPTSQEIERMMKRFGGWANGERWDTVIYLVLGQISCTSFESLRYCSRALSRVTRDCFTTTDLKVLSDSQSIPPVMSMVDPVPPLPPAVASVG